MILSGPIYELKHLHLGPWTSLYCTFSCLYPYILHGSWILIGSFPRNFEQVAVTGVRFIFYEKS